MTRDVNLTVLFIDKIYMEMLIQQFIASKCSRQGAPTSAKNAAQQTSGAGYCRQPGYGHNCTVQ